MPDYHEHADLINRLGDGTVVATELWGAEASRDKRRRENVYKWKTNGIPWRWRYAVKRLADERGVQVPKDFLEDTGIAA